MGDHSKTSEEEKEEIEETPTNTLILTDFTAEELEDESIIELLFGEVKRNTPSDEIIKFIKLPKFNRILMIFENRESSKTLYEILKSLQFNVSFSVRDNSISTKEFLLKLPSSGTKYVISPPPSPPSGWISTEEQKPDTRVIHNPHELHNLLFEKLGDRIVERFGKVPGEDSTKLDDDTHETEADADADADEEDDDDFDEKNGRLKVPKVLIGRANGNPIILLEAAKDTTNNGERKSVNTFKTQMPPI
ncbi:hypothetical protein PACTADRAFT_51667 [Pachysolen tannophilus NRRL Y-2460]|uniref:Calcipressin n=1 Tax=Pachysolen tannophilus NRRL Y-2460 TaxID=669874 RepID=A0A1E4TQ94_PACTA|nr:hypothetical protein PACTADRAFT_51667 [Pachysolen tannophilus NRRL Y-2460]